LLGLCQANDPYYGQLLVDKMLFMVPDDQARLRDCMRHRNLLDEFLSLADEHAGAPWFQRNATLFLEVCDLFSATARQHHDQLVNRFITVPAQSIDARHLSALTASGPSLETLLQALEILRDYRVAAADRPGLETRHRDIERLRALCHVAV
jgi:hypothetical protein